MPITSCQSATLFFYFYSEYWNRTSLLKLQNFTNYFISKFDIKCGISIFLKSDVNQEILILKKKGVNLTDSEVRTYKYIRVGIDKSYTK